MRFEDALLASLCAAALLTTLLLPLFEANSGPLPQPRPACTDPLDTSPDCPALPRPHDVR